jgi:hypothetical protein
MMQCQLRDYNIILDSVDGNMTDFANVKKLPFVDWAAAEDKRRRDIKKQKKV